jgi:hypothetical protein
LKLAHGIGIFGYSDAVDNFVNGQKVFQGDATYISRDIQFLGTVSMRGAMAPRLKKGANQVGVKVKENYGGWAAAAELPIWPRSAGRC